MGSWESGLPTVDDLIPLSQSLVSPELAHAFGISPEPSKTLLELNHSSWGTAAASFSQRRQGEPGVEKAGVRGLGGGGEMEYLYSGLQVVGNNGKNSSLARASKKPRFAWTPQLHRKFVDAVTNLGPNDAVPKKIVQLMNVEGLTREKVASHLQKYRVYIKKMQRDSGGDLPK